MEIKNHYTQDVLYTSKKLTMRETLAEAVGEGANLGGAYLQGANLRGADLGGAYLGGAYLGGAYLGGAYLGGAYLGGADLQGANLGGANLGGAYLGGAYLGGADLQGADLQGANLGGANLRGANLGGANLGRANLAGADLGSALEDTPLIENIDAAILAAIEHSQALDKAGLNMTSWHTCESTHCRAGWAIHLAGKEGYALEDKYGPSMAGALLYLKAGATKIPNWVATDEEAMTDMRERAGVQA